jgi:hypothetical protein
MPDIPPAELRVVLVFGESDGDGSLGIPKYASIVVENGFAELKSDSIPR